MYFDESEIRKAIATLKADGQLFEIRIIPSGRKPISGYFKNADTFLNALKKQDLRNANVYFVLNAIDEACYSREQRDKFAVSAASTSDGDIIARQWILIDFDPKRPKDTSSTNEQIEKSHLKCASVYKYLEEQGLSSPIVAMSGNGYHLLYRIEMKATKENNELIRRFLEALDELFSNDEIKIDKVNFNESRVCKLYGTLAQKGSNTEDRPHRMSRIVKIPEKIKPVDIAYIKKIANLIKFEERKPSRYNNYSSEFDLEDWMREHGIGYRESSYAGGVRYWLDHCPFDSSHNKKDAAIFKRSNGAIGFKCFHNSCADKTWRDVRELFEPDAYERKEWDKQVFQSHNRDKPEPKHIQQKGEEPIFYTALEVVKRPKQTEEIIKTGIELFDRRYRGFRKKDVTILSGYTGGAKSTLLSELILNAVDSGNNVACFSGELAEDDYFRWMIQQAAGKNHVQPSRWEGYYNVPQETRIKIAEWLDGHFWLYNNKYGFNFGAIIEQLSSLIEKHKLDMLCIDNLMALDISELSKEKYDAQSVFAWKIHEMAQRKNVHVIIVCHPRKPVGLLGRYDVSGTSDIVNAVDNIIFVYRVDQTFRNYYKQFFGKDFKGDGTNAWHCDKARFGSVDDSYNSLYYELETKRLRNDKSETKIYGWAKNIPQDDFITGNDEDIPF